MSAAELPSVTRNERGDEIRQRRAAQGMTKADLQRAITEHQGKPISIDAITAAEAGTASETTYMRIEAFLDHREEEAGFEPGETLRPVEDVPPPPNDVIEFDVEGPSSKWRVHAKASKGNADETIEALTKLIASLRDGDGPDEDGGED